MQEDNLQQNIQNSHDAKNDSDGQAGLTEKPDSSGPIIQPEDGGVDFLSVAELARRLSLPESSTRFYCKRFAAYLPYLGEGRRRRYSPQALDVLRRVLFLMAKNKDARGVEKELPKYFPRVHRGISRDIAATASGDGIVEAPDDYGSPEVCIPLCQPGEALVSDKIFSLLERQTLALEGLASGMNELCAELRSKLPALPPEGGAEDGHAAPLKSGQPQPETPEKQTSVITGTSEPAQAAESAAYAPALQELRLELSGELQSLKRLVSSLENTQQEDLQQLRDWLGRLAQELRQKTIS